MTLFLPLTETLLGVMSGSPFPASIRWTVSLVPATTNMFRRTASPPRWTLIETLLIYR